MERVSWIEHKGKKILYLNYSGLRAPLPADKKIILGIIEQGKALTRTSAEKIRFLSDVTNTVSDKEVIDALKEFANYTSGLGKMEKECAVGVSGLQKTLVSMINLMSRAKLKMFDTVEEAKEWLVE